VGGAGVVLSGLNACWGVADMRTGNMAGMFEGAQRGDVASVCHVHVECRIGSLHARCYVQEQALSVFCCTQGGSWGGVSVCSRVLSFKGVRRSVDRLPSRLKDFWCMWMCHFWMPNGKRTPDSSAQGSGLCVVEVSEQACSNFLHKTQHTYGCASQVVNCSTAA
jgi:hypothetical protein